MCSLGNSANGCKVKKLCNEFKGLFKYHIYAGKELYVDTSYIYKQPRKTSP